jgi:vancomycin aglycone glucosyltransferase
MGARILLSAIGTRGDVEPLVALGCGLKSRGHSVLISAPADFECLIRRRGLPYGEAAPAAQKLLRMSRSTSWPIALAGQIDEQFLNLDAQAKGCDLIVSSILQLAAPSIAEKNKTRILLTTVAPPYLNILRSCNWFPRLVEAVNENRRRLRLEPTQDLTRQLMETGAIFITAEPALLPPSRKAPYPITGTLFPQEEGPLDKELDNFLKLGDPPVYIGFGSMILSRPEILLHSILEAASKARVRVVLNVGWSGFETTRFPSWCYPVYDSPHGALFQKVRAAIHHGGSGTTAAAALAGLPQGILPHIADQHYWAKRVQSLGIGIAPANLEAASVEVLDEILDNLLYDDKIAFSAKELSTRITRTAGLRNALAFVELALEQS